MTRVEGLARELLLAMGENPEREGLKETPARFARAFKELYRGYNQTPDDLARLVKTFSSKTKSMVVQTGVPVYSFCEHHMIPFFGTCNIAYIPKKRVIGASKITRIVDHFARRLQIQEELTEQIGEALMVSLKPKGLMMAMSCVHLCMVYRGVKESPTLVTELVRGVFRKSAAARQEFLSITGGRPRLIQLQGG